MFLAVLASPCLATAQASVEQLEEQAAALERQGDRLGAAELYEQIVKADPALRGVLAATLAELYARSGAVEKALAWAGVVMEKNPDPVAYLAGIHALLGNLEQAAGLIGKELEADPPPRRRVALLWQLADVRVAQGDLVEAEARLAAGVEAAAGLPEEATARRRLEGFLKMTKPWRAAGTKGNGFNDGKR